MDDDSHTIAYDLSDPRRVAVRENGGGSEKGSQPLNTSKAKPKQRKLPSWMSTSKSTSASQRGTGKAKNTNSKKASGSGTRSSGDALEDGRKVSKHKTGAIRDAVKKMKRGSTLESTGRNRKKRQIHDDKDDDDDYDDIGNDHDEKPLNDADENSDEEWLLSVSASADGNSDEVGHRRKKMNYEIENPNGAVAMEKSQDRIEGVDTLLYEDVNMNSNEDVAADGDGGGDDRAAGKIGKKTSRDDIYDESADEDAWEGDVRVHVNDEVNDDDDDELNGMSDIFNVIAGNERGKKSSNKKSTASMKNDGDQHYVDSVSQSVNGGDLVLRAKPKKKVASRKLIHGGARDGSHDENENETSRFMEVPVELAELFVGAISGTASSSTSDSASTSKSMSDLSIKERARKRLNRKKRQEAALERVRARGTNGSRMKKVYLKEEVNQNHNQMHDADHPDPTRESANDLDQHHRNAEESAATVDEASRSPSENGTDGGGGKMHSSGEWTSKSLITPRRAVKSSKRILYRDDEVDDDNDDILSPERKRQRESMNRLLKLKFVESQQDDEATPPAYAHALASEVANDEFTFKARKRLLKMSDMEDRPAPPPPVKLSPVKPNMTVRSKRRKA